MPFGPAVNLPRPFAKTLSVVAVVTEDEVDLDEDPTLVTEINENLRDIDVGPGFKAKTIESLTPASKKPDAMFRTDATPNPLEIFEAEWNGIMLTFDLPAFSEKQIEQMKDAVDKSVDTDVRFHAVGCM